MPDEKTPAKSDGNKDNELLFIAPPAEFLVEKVGENDSSSWRKFKENPVAPAGMLLTVFAIANGLRYMVKKDSVRQQRMMRLRVGAQAFSVAAILGGIMFASLPK